MVQVAGGEKRPLAAQVQLLTGQSAEQQGNPQAALAAYEKALKFDPSLVEAHNNLGNLLDNLGRPDEALAHYQSAANLRPDMALVHENLGTQLVELGRFDDAMREYQAAARLAPLDPQPEYLMGKAWLRRGQSREAVAAFQEALRLEPDDLQSLTFLARRLASDPDPQIRNGTQAVALAEKANALTGRNQPFVLGTLAMAYAEAGRFDEAREAVQSALGLATSGNNNTISAWQAQLRLYESNEPYREVFTNPPRQMQP
jgi:tetratricopeptide (TPR) repeat protein